MSVIDIRLDSLLLHGVPHKWKTICFVCFFIEIKMQFTFAVSSKNLIKCKQRSNAWNDARCSDSNRKIIIIHQKKKKASKIVHKPINLKFTILIICMIRCGCCVCAVCKAENIFNEWKSTTWWLIVDSWWHCSIRNFLLMRFWKMHQTITTPPSNDVRI